MLRGLSECNALREMRALCATIPPILAQTTCSCRSAVQPDVLITSRISFAISLVEECAKDLSDSPCRRCRESEKNTYLVARGRSMWYDYQSLLNIPSACPTRTMPKQGNPPTKCGPQAWWNHCLARRFIDAQVARWLQRSVLWRLLNLNHGGRCC